METIDYKNIPSEIKDLAIELQKKGLAVSMRDAVDLAFRITERKKEIPKEVRFDMKVEQPDITNTALDATFDKFLEKNPEFGAEDKPLREVMSGEESAEEAKPLDQVSETQSVSEHAQEPKVLDREAEVTEEAKPIDIKEPEEIKPEEKEEIQEKEETEEEKESGDT